MYYMYELYSHTSVVFRPETLLRFISCILRTDGRLGMFRVNSFPHPLWHIKGLNEDEPSSSPRIIFSFFFYFNFELFIK